MKDSIVFGSSEPRFYTLTGVTGTITTIALEMYKRGDGGTLTLVDDPPDVSVEDHDEDEKTVTVKVLGCEDLAIGLYQVRFELNGGDGYVPNEEHSDLWLVVPVGNR